VLARLFDVRVVRIDRTYQLNFGGNTDFLNMLERERLESKKISKTSAVTSVIPYALPEEDIHVGPSDYVPWLKDRKWCHIRMEGTTFGDVPLNLELKLEVWDSPNSAGIVIDAVRCAKLALDHKLKGALFGASSYFKKSPPAQVPDELARELVEEFIRDPQSELRFRKQMLAPQPSSVAVSANGAARARAARGAGAMTGTGNGNGAGDKRPSRRGRRRRKTASARRSH
jgi:myo-inositol-1-phosphate synthase